MLQDLRPVVHTLAQAVVPEAAHLDAAGWADLDAIIEQALAARSPALGRQLRWLIRALQWLPFLYYGRPLTTLDPVRRSRFIERVQRAPFLVVRRGFWGLRTLLLMGYYGRPAGAAAVGYRGDPRGWAARA